MPQAWRIVREKYTATAFSGEGASRTGGRWNSRGGWMVYTSASKSLAALEMLVHLNPPVLFIYVAFRMEFENSLVEKLPVANLSPDWREEPAPPSTKTIGDLWLKQARSAVLSVPSVIIPDETNYLLNPLHKDFDKVVIGEPEPFIFDPRLL